MTTSYFDQHWHLTNHRTPKLTSFFTCSLFSPFSHLEMLDIYWPMHLFHFSLPAIQYPSPLHGHRWITRPGLAQLTERCWSSENTPLPSYSNGLCVRWLSLLLLWYTMEDRERSGREGGREGEARRWDRGGMMRRRELPLSLGENRNANSWDGVQTQELDNFEIQPSSLRTNCSPAFAAPLPANPTPPRSPSHFMPLSRQVGGSSETGWHGHRLPLPPKSLKGNWAFQPTPLICVTLPMS